ncbi:MAG: crossover junction endodeoxyribonuclease RuvC [Patescibacteria group bacterium]
MSKIIGIDPGFDRLGFAIIVVDGCRVRAIDFGVITTDKKDEFGSRLLQLEKDLLCLLKEHKPDLLSMEKLYTTVNQKTAMKVAEARGVVTLTAARCKLPTVEFTPNQVKSAVTGNGAADKKAMQKMVTRLFNLSCVPKPDDAADALAIALTASTGLISRNIR